MRYRFRGAIGRSATGQMSDAAKIVEPQPARPSRTDEELLAYRLRQQSVLTQFGHKALEASDFDQLFSAAVRLCATGMRAAFCKVLEYLPDRNRLLVRAGIGWRPGVVGHSTLGIEKDFPAGFVFQTGKPVISNHLEHERRFQTPPLLAEHGVKRSVTVPITLARGHPWGVLAADSPDEGQFDAPDIAFMQGVAQLLGAAIQRLRNEGALRAGEERFRSLYEAQQTPHLVLSTDFIIEAASPAYLKATMTRAKDLVGRNMFDAFPDNPDDPEATGVRNLSASLNRVLEHCRPDRMAVQKYDIRRPDGEFEERWWAPINIPVFATDGSVRSIIHQVEDVTAEIRERQKVAEAKAGEARLRELADAIPGLVFETDAEGRNTYVNGQYCAYTGRPLSALLGHGWREAIHPDDWERALAGWLEAVHTGQPFETECRIRRADGAWRWFMLRASAIRGSDGEVEKGIGVCTDVDDAKRAEAALRESEEQFRTMADALPQLAWMADEKGWIYWYNRRWYEYTGTRLEEMEGWGWRKVHHPDHVDRVVERIKLSWETGEPWEDTFPLRGADGQYRWFLSRAVPLRDADGRVTRWFGTNTDITERQKLEEFQALLIREISHRVKNSLALVSALLHLQARTLGDPSRTALADAASRVQAVATVHDQLFREADAREVDLEPFLCNLASAISTAGPKHETIARIAHAMVSADMAVPIGLLVNELVTNAYKYAYPSGEEGEVRIIGERLGDSRYRLEVRDCGCGLPEGFDVDRPSTSSLGMRVITSLSRQLRGELKASSAEPGARFTLVFPLEAPSSLETRPA
jgi:PAS domain S-box-containing protein